MHLLFVLLVSMWGRVRWEVTVAYLNVDCIWNVTAHAQKPDFVFRRNGRVQLNRRGGGFSWSMAAEVCAWAVVMLDTPCSEVVWRVLATHSIRQFPLHFPSLVSPCAITFHLDYTSLSPSCKIVEIWENLTKFGALAEAPQGKSWLQAVGFCFLGSLKKRIYS